MQLKTILNRVEWYKSFVYGEAKWNETGDAIEIPIEPRKNGQAICSGCGQAAPGYDQSSRPRRFEFVPLWGIAVFFVYCMHRVQCPRCGVKVEQVPWTLMSHRELLMNWFRAKGTISAGVVEGLNNKVKLTMRKSYGFRTKNAGEIALYHNLANLPEPEFPHRFWLKMLGQSTMIQSPRWSSHRRRHNSPDELRRNDGRFAVARLILNFAYRRKMLIPKEPKEFHDWLVCAVENHAGIILRARGALQVHRGDDLKSTAASRFRADNQFRQATTSVAIIAWDQGRSFTLRNA